jgi:hypothetical protein
MELSDDDRRLVAAWAADCVERVLPRFEARAPANRRPREALEAARTFAAGGRRTAKLRAIAMAAYAAAREVDDAGAAAAARAAGLAAAVAYMHALPTTDQAKHALGPAAYAARARELAEGAAAGEAEIAEAIARASGAVREIVGRFPARGAGGGRLEAWLCALDAGLRG